MQTHKKQRHPSIPNVKAVDILGTIAIIHLLTLLGSATHCTQGDGPGHQRQLCVALVSKDVLRRLWRRAGLSCAVGSEHYCFHTLENQGLYMEFGSLFGQTSEFGSVFGQTSEFGGLGFGKPSTTSLDLPCNHFPTSGSIVQNPFLSLHA